MTQPIDKMTAEIERVILLPMEPQPPYGTAEPTGQPGQFVWLNTPKAGLWYRTAPHQPGDVLPVREEWRVLCYRCNDATAYYEIEYRDGQVLQLPVDKTQLLDEPISELMNPQWHAAHTMPDWAARSHYKVVSIRPVDLRELTEDEAVAAGFTIPLHIGGELQEKDYPMVQLRKHWTATHPDAVFGWAWWMEVSDA